MTLQVAVPRHQRLGEGFPRREQIEADVLHPGRRTDGTQSRASWILDLISLRKLLTLCGWCARQFNYRRHGYRRFYVNDFTGITNGYAVSGQCDGCTTAMHATGLGFVAEEAYKLTCVDPTEQRRHARLRARHAESVWQAVNRRASRRTHETAAEKGAVA